MADNAPLRISLHITQTVSYNWVAYVKKTADQEMNAILLIIGIVYWVFRIVIKSVQQCRYFLFFVNLTVSYNWVAYVKKTANWFLANS
jgi:hypothetical protein